MLFSKPLAVSTASREVKRSRSSRSVLAVAFSMRPIRGQISQQIAAAWSTSGSVLWFDPMKLAWNNRQHYRLCLYLPSVNSPRCQTFLFFFPLFVLLSAGSTHGHFCSCISQFTFCISCLNLITPACLQRPLPEYVKLLYGWILTWSHWSIKRQFLRYPNKCVSL